MQVQCSGSGCVRMVDARPSALRRCSIRFCSVRCLGAIRARRLTVRFWLKAGGGDTAPGVCWDWRGTTTIAGYGQMRSGGKHEPKFYAHRVAWELAAGPIPEWADVLHTCDRPTCVRNDETGFYEVNGILRPRRGHLWLGTPDDNSADKWAKGRGPSGDNHYSRARPWLQRRAEQCSYAKLTWARVDEIRASTEPRPVLANRYGVSESLIYMVQTERSWTAIPNQ